MLDKVVSEFGFYLVMEDLMMEKKVVLFVFVIVLVVVVDGVLVVDISV